MVATRANTIKLLRNDHCLILLNAGKQLRTSILLLLSALLCACASVGPEAKSEAKPEIAVSFGFNKQPQDVSRNAEDEDSVRCDGLDLDHYFAKQLASSTRVSESQFGLTYSYYDLEPKNVRDLANQVLTRSPYCASHHATTADAKAIGLTRMRHFIRWQSAQNNKSCTVRAVQLFVLIDMKLPRIKPGYQADVKTQRTFDILLETVASHEDIHKKYDVNGAKQLFQGLVDDVVGQPCSSAKDLIAQLNNSIFGQLEVKHRKFDKAFKPLAAGVGLYNYFETLSELENDSVTVTE